MDLQGGDIQCSEKEICRGFPPSSPEQAKAVCNSFGSRCKGFVYTVQTGKFYLKEELKGKMISSPANELFIKKAFYQGIKFEARRDLRSRIGSVPVLS